MILQQDFKDLQKTMKNVKEKCKHAVEQSASVHQSAWYKCLSKKEKYLAFKEKIIMQHKSGRCVKVINDLEKKTHE